MLSGLGSIIELLKSLPAILGVLLELRRLWNQFVDQEDRRVQMVALQDAFKEAREKRDTTQLTSLVNSIITGKPLPPGK